MAPVCRASSWCGVILVSSDWVWYMDPELHPNVGKKKVTVRMSSITCVKKKLKLL